ncbi:carbohydrate esterase family 3 protein, partial [Whalleya microplaca]
MSASLEKAVGSWKSRLQFLRSKRVIAASIASLSAIVVVIVLAATGKIHTGNSVNNVSSGSQLAGMDGGSPTTSSVLQGTDVFSTSLLSATTISSMSKVTPTSTATSSATLSSANPNDAPLRIMAIGASIIKGETSPGYLGLRKPMRDELVKLGFTVNMVGLVRLGDFVDNDVEAYGGKLIKAMHEDAKKAVPKMQPNVFVIHLGTNNLLQNKDVDKVGEQMEAMIDYLLTASNRSVVILSTMLTNTVGGGKLEPTVLDMNRQYRDIMKGFEADNKPVVLAEMHPSNGGSDVPKTNDIGPDGSHPTVQGYEKMGHIFVKAIQKAKKKGVIQEPFNNRIPDDGEAERM